MFKFTKTLARTSLLALGLATTGACDDAADTSEFVDGVTDWRCPRCTGGGGWYNTFTWGEKQVSEVVLGAFSPDGTYLISVEVKFDGVYTPLDDLFSKHGQLHGTINGYEDLFNGYDFTDSRWTAWTGSEIVVYHITQTAEVNDLWKYWFEDISGGPEEAIPACGQDLDPVMGEEPYPAVVIENLTGDENTGILDHNPVTGSMFISCDTGGVGKAVTWGYAPYHAEENEQDFTAAVRMVRLDLCGDGYSFTEQGSEVEVFDHLGNNWGNEESKLEAVWGPEGAICVDKATRTGASTEDILCNGVPLPSCEEGGWPNFYNPGAFTMTRL